jgi:hypothetical protein
LSFPSVRAGFVKKLEVILFTKRLQAEEDKSCREIRIIPDDFLVDFIKSTHVSTLIMEFHEVSLRVIFGELAE